jgi:hypothetical protein
VTSPDPGRPAGSEPEPTRPAGPEAEADVPAVPGREPAQPEPAQPEPALPEQSREDTDAGWGEYPESADDRLYRDRPPHWDDR